MNPFINLFLVSSAARSCTPKVRHSHSKSRTKSTSKKSSQKYTPSKSNPSQKTISSTRSLNESTSLSLYPSDDTYTKALYSADATTDMSPSSGPFSLPPLEYSYRALEPYIDEATLRVHHDGHHRTYVNNLNAALSRYPEFYNWTLEQLLLFSDRLPSDIQTQVINNAGGHYNHSLMWKLIGPPNKSEPTGKFKEAIGSLDNLKATLKASGSSVFGSGYSWLVLNPYGRLQVVTTSNQITPIPLRTIPILPLDVWEHAYYLKHQNKRGDYIDDYFNVVNWERVSERYESALEQLKNTPSV